MDKFGKLALEECISEETMTRRGGIDGKPFWNTYATQFMYVPTFFFSSIWGIEEYIYTATDSKGDTYTFTADNSSAPLTPIWKDLAYGMVELKVEAVCKATGRNYLAGARTFCKMEPFPGRSALPPKARSYKECAIKAFRYVFNDEVTRHWLTHGVPEPDYYNNVYASKTFSSVIRAMIAYAELEPENAKDALKIATNAADYLLSITYGEDSQLPHIPPTYSFKGLNKEKVDALAPAADGRKHQVMMIYPTFVGRAYLQLEKVTGDKKYFDAALKIAEYYKNNVLENGSWYLLVSEQTGEHENTNFCLDFTMLPFFTDMYERTGDECWRTIERNYFECIKNESLENYNWEAQFEDVKLTSSYYNLCHKNADAMIGYIVDYLSDDKEMMGEAIELMRYVEDQFVVWTDFAPWCYWHYKEQQWYSPAGLEQYLWYVPIDGSADGIIKAFLKLYSATKNELYLEKAFALGDSITRMQNDETGVIPTHWMTTDCTTNLYLFWMNCHVGSAFTMLELAKANGEL